MTRMAGIVLPCLMPGIGFDCALPPSVILLLPTGLCPAAAGLTVALTATLGALSRQLPVMTPVQVLERRVLLLLTVASVLGLPGIGARRPFRQH